jgi:SAM-dependent methyltransferase
MSRPTASLPASYFEALYAADPDPWQFRSSEYESRKYATTLAALPRERYGRALEVGCSIGVLTRALAARCDRLVAIDGAARAIAAAQRHCGELPGLTLMQREVPRGWPRGRYDLILLSEILYYFDEDDLASVAALCLRDLQPGADLLLVHWVGTTDYPLSGDAAVAAFEAALGDEVTALARSRTDRYRLDLLRRAPAG